MLLAALPVGQGLQLKAESDGLLCASGSAGLPDHPVSMPDIASYSGVAVLPTKIAEPSLLSLPVGTRLASNPVHLTEEYQRDYLRDVSETHPLFTRDGLAPPGLLLRFANWVLADNVVLDVWIHVGSVYQSLGVARVGEMLTAYACVADNYAHKGHQFIKLYVLVLAHARPVAQIIHTAIYRPRQLAAL